MRYRLAAVSVLLLSVLACAPAVAQVTSVTVVEKAGVTTANYPMTVSMIFKQGDVASNVTAAVGGTNLTTQTDVKVRWPDNSVKHALVSFVIPSMPANGSVTVSFNSGGTNANSSYTTKAQLLATDFDARMTITPSGGSATTITARNLLNGIANPEYWIQGQVCSEFLIRDFSQNISNQLNVQYYVRYYPGWSGFRVDAVVENCWTEYRGNLTYDFNLLLGNSNPQSVFSKTGFAHNFNARWHKVFWQGTTPPAIEVRYNLPYMTSTKLLPNYDTSLVVPESTISSEYTNWQASTHDIMQHGIIMVYFPTTGGRQEVGLNPAWAARYLLSMDNRMKEITLNCGDLSGSIPIHLREGNPAKSAKNHVMTIDDRPTVWASNWSYTYTAPADALPAPVGSTTTEWTVDCSHQAAFGQVPYLATGDFYYLEEMYFWGAWDLADSNYSYRGSSQGFMNDQARGDAWAIRNISDAGNLAPDAQTLEKSYFTNKTNNNINNWVNRYITTGNYPSIHYWQDQSNIGQDGGRPDSDLVTTCRYYTSPWMDDFVLTVLTHMKDVGWNTSSLVDWLGASIVNRFSNASYNWYRGAPYHIPTQYNDGNNNGIPYATWADVNAAFAAQPGPTDFPNPDYADDYTFISRCAMSGVVHLTNGQTTWNWLDSHLYSKSTLNDNPTWGIIPRGTVPPSDTIAPAAVTNLATSSPTSGSITLTWTAPGDDNNTGTATSYDIRYRTGGAVDSTNWATATQVTGEPTPAVAGTNQNMVVTGLSANTTYYFAIKTSDEVPNTSAISNSPSGTTAAAGDTTAPAAVSNLATSSPTSSSLTLTWTAPGDDGNTGTATSYDIRYSTSTIDGTNWATATQVTGEPAPQVAGSNQNMVISGLSAGTTYYFAMETSDEVPNTSALSNVASGTTSAAGGPTVQFSTTTSSGSEATTPANIAVTLSQSSSQTVTVSYAVTGGSATQGTDYTLPPGGNQVIALKRDAGLLQGGAIDSRFTSLGAGDVRLATIKDAQVWGSGDARYQNFGVRTQVPSSGGGGQGVIAWDLSAYAGGTVNKAQLRFKCTMGNNTMQWAAIKSHNWDEGNKDSNYPGVAPSAPGVTWAHPSATNTTNTGPLGWGASSNAMLDTAGNGADLYAYTDFVSMPGGNTFVVADVTSAVQEWLSGTKPNYGLLIQSGNHDPYLSEAGTDNEPVLFLDVTLPGGLVQFSPGQTSKVIPITIVNDTIAEPNETIQLTLSNPANATLGANTVSTYTILDDDNQAPVVDAGANQTITLPAAANLAGTATDDGYPNPPGAVTVTWTKVSGPGTVTFGNANALSTTATFSAAGTYVLQLQASDSALQSTDTLTVTANPQPTVQFQATSSSGSESVTAVNLAVTLSAASTNTVTVSYAVTGGTATTPADYTINGTSLTFNAGETSKNVPITVVDDALVEGNETIIVTLSSPGNATLGTNTTHTYTIIDNDTGVTPTVQFSTTSSSGSEATTAVNLTVSLSAASTNTVTVDYNVTGGTATQGSDYTLSGSVGNQVIALKRDAGLLQGGTIDSRFTGLTGANVVTAAVKDAVIAGGGNGAFMNYGTTNWANGYTGGPSCTFGWNLSAYAGGTVNKAQIRLHCTQGNTNMWFAGIKTHDWAEGNKNGDYPGVAPAAAGICWNHPNGMYASNSGTFGWGAASNSAFDETANTGDVYDHVDFVSVPGGDAYVVADVTSLVQDWLSGAKPNYGLYVNIGNHSVHLSEIGTDSEPVLFLDVSLPQRRVTFSPGQTSQTIPITVINDTVGEYDETIQLTLSNPVSATLGTNTTHTYTIIDNDVMDCTAISESTIYGTLTGNYQNTWASDNSYEALKEVMNGTSYSWLENRWTFNVRHGSSIQFRIEAYRPSNSDSDNFQFAYSTNGTTWTNMVSVTKTSDNNTDQTYSLPATTSGTVYVRVQDTNRVSGKNSLDTLYIDRMVIRSNP